MSEEYRKALIDPEPIPDLLAWQKGIDDSGLCLNLRGSARFWREVSRRLGVPIYRNGCPECSEIIFELEPGVGLRLSTDRIEEGDDDLAGWTPNIRFEFVAVEDGD